MRWQFFAQQDTTFKQYVLFHVASQKKTRRNTLFVSCILYLRIVLAKKWHLYKQDGFDKFLHAFTVWATDNGTFHLKILILSFTPGGEI